MILEIAIGKIFLNQPFSENKTVINGETIQIYCPYISRDLIYQKLHPLRDAAFGADCFTPFRILKIVIVGLKILVMLSRIATCCKKIFQILIRSPL